MAPRSRVMEFHAWREQAENASGGLGVPRPFDMSTMPESALHEANARAQRFGMEIGAVAHAELQAINERLANAQADANPDYIATVQKRAQKLEAALPALEAASGIDTSIPAMTSNAQMLINGQLQHARSATRFREQAGSTALELPAGFDFYPEHGGAYTKIAAKHYGVGDTEARTRLLLASTPFSAGAMPQVELKGAAGLALLDANSSEWGVSINEHAAQYLNTAKVKGGLAADQRPQIEPGLHNLASLPVEHASLLIQAQARALKDPAKVHEALLNGVQFGEEAREMAPGAQFLMGGAGTSGAGIVANAMRTMRDPSNWSELPATAGAWKVPSYSTTNLLFDDPNLHQALTHMMGAATHGNKYWDANPGALEHTLQHAKHPALTNPLITSDIHNARAVVGRELGYELSKRLGDKVRPEAWFTRSKLMGKDDISSGRPTGVKLQDLGYMAQEHATREASLSVPLGRGRNMQMPGHVKQALIWYAQQALSPNNAAALERGTKSRLHSDIQADPTRSLNPIRLPELAPR